MGVLDFLLVARMRQLIIGWAMLVGLGVALALAVVLPTKYESIAKVQVDSIQRNDLTGLVEPRVRVAEYLGQQAAVAASRVVALKVIDMLVADGALVLSDYESRWRKETGGELIAGNDKRLWAADELLHDLKITANDIESTLELSYRAEDPAQAARIANAFASAYMETIADKKQRRFSRKAASFSDETRSLADDVNRAQDELAAYREVSGILPLGVQKIEAAEVEYAALTARLAEARADEAEALSLLRQAQTTPRGQLVNFPLPDDAIPGRQAQMRLAAVSATLARIADRFGPQYPDYIEAAREKAALEDNILQSIVDRADYATRRVSALEASAAKMKAELTEMQTMRQKYDLLENKVSASQDTYNLVATRSLQEALQARVDSIDVFLLARGVPASEPATPPFWIVVLLGVAAGATIGAGAAVFVELYEGRVRSADAVRQAFRTQVTGEVTPPRRKRGFAPRFFVRNTA